MELQKVLLINLGGSNTQLIARMVRKKGVYSEIIPCTTELKKIKKRDAHALIISGGPERLNEEVFSLLDRGVFELELPIMAVGHGLGVLPGIDAFDKRNIADKLRRLHYKTVFDGFEAGKDSPGAVPAPLLVAPFLPEERSGGQFLDYFLFEVAGLEPTWTSASFIKHAVEAIRSEVAEDARAVCGLSGGIDSVVAALLVHRAIGDRLTCIFVDHGLMREGEAEQVTEIYRRGYNLPVKVVDAATEFIDRLGGVTDPEEKRRIIGEHFIRVFEREADYLEGVEYLVQGTIYPDIIESISPSGEVIKSHHNVGGLPEKMRLKLIEPIKELFKDEVRDVAEIMGLPAEIVWRQPFPGPGLGVRILGEVTEEKIRIVRRANAIVEEEVERAGLTYSIWQCFAILPEIRSVGVEKGRRTYAHSIILRAVTSRDAMTAEWYRFPHDFLDRLARRITAEIPEVNRVLYDITSKPPATIEWE